MIVFMAAAVISVPLARRFGMGSILGYLVAGALLGLLFQDWVGHDVAEVLEVSEFGVVMMLFLIGLELDIGKLWSMRAGIIGLGGSQVVLFSALMAGVLILFGMEWPAAVGAGLILSLSSMAIVLPSLQERGLLNSPGGQSAFAVLLCHDVASIPILAALPILAQISKAGEAGSTLPSGADGLSGWEHALAILAAVALIILAGRFLVRPLLRVIATTRMHEMFTAAAFLIVLGIVLLTDFVGLDAAIGAFIGGIVLADSEYRHQIEADIAPFKGILLGIFFVAVGASIHFQALLASPLLVLGILLLLILVKGSLIYGLSRLFGTGHRSSVLAGVSLAQGDEFAFVLLPMAVGLGVLTETWGNILNIVVVLSMALTPIYFMLLERAGDKRATKTLATREPPGEEIPDSGEPDSLIVGFGEFGTVVGGLLTAHDHRVSILDINPERIDIVRKLGYQAYYGDGSRLPVLSAAGADAASNLLILVQDPAQSLKIARIARQYYPHLKIYARAFNRLHAYELINMGIHEVFPQSRGTALEMGYELLVKSGHPVRDAEQAIRQYREMDNALLQALSQHKGKRDAGYFRKARQHLELYEEAVKASREKTPTPSNPESQ